MIHVFLSPDGGINLGLLLVVEAATGVTYEQQCAGHLTEQRQLEGFLVPVGGQAEAKKIYDWFWDRFQGNCYQTPMTKPCTTETISELSDLVAEICCWHSTSPDDGEPHFLKLDTQRMDECVEAWIPVISPYGRGILTLENSD